MHNDLENFRSTTEHRRPGRVLYYANFTPDLLRRVKEHIGTDDVRTHYGFARSRSLAMRRPGGLPPLDYSPYYADEELPEGTIFNAFGAARVPSGFYHFFGYIHPLRNASSIAELEDYPMYEMSDWDCSWMSEAVADAHSRGQYAVGTVGHIFEWAWQIRGLELFLMDMLTKPDWDECLLERIAQQNMVKALAYTRAGVDMLHCGDDVAWQQGLMLPVDLWREMIHSRWSLIWREARRVNPDIRIWYHSDGNIMEIVDDLVEAGVDVLNPLQPECMDIDEVHRRFGDRLTFAGCMGTQSTMPFGTPDDVRNRVKELIDKYGQNGGLIVAPTHILEPEVPLENIDAFADACREYGSFDDNC